MYRRFQYKEWCNIARAASVQESELKQGPMVGATLILNSELKPRQEPIGMSLNHFSTNKAAS